jgi:hypothetical protein
MTVANQNSAVSATVVTQYEDLRRAALGGALAPEARAGLMLFLQRGMWGWARALAGAFERPTNSQISNWQAPDEYRAVIHLLAALVTRKELLHE